MGIAICIYGPTGVGKTAFAEQLAGTIAGEIINYDAAQFYRELSIGTAKPDIHTQKVTYHMVDLCTEPEDFSVAAYRKAVIPLIAQIQARDKIPIFVGGSGFYMNSLFFALPEQRKGAELVFSESKPLWDQLNVIDPARAAMLHPHDTYRIRRALILYQQNNALPSALKPHYSPITHFILITLTRSTEDLKKRIALRVGHMLQDGWIEEVDALLNTSWEGFLLKKKWIGYPALIAWCRAGKKGAALYQVIETIERETWRYARKQMAYARMFAKQLSSTAPNTSIIPINLTSYTDELYLKQLKTSLTEFQKGLSNE